jgi:hypothetical protein
MPGLLVAKDGVKTLNTRGFRLIGGSCGAAVGPSDVRLRRTMTAWPTRSASPSITTRGCPVVVSNLRLWLRPLCVMAETTLIEPFIQSG